MYRNAVYAVAVAFILALGATIFVFQSLKTGGKTYSNSVYGYSLTYPANLDVREYTDDNTVVGTISNDTVQAQADIRVITAQGEAGQSMSDAVADQLKKLCAADGPTESFSCTSTLATEPYNTLHGDSGYILILQGVLKNLITGSTTAVTKGPYFVLPITSSATITKVVVVSPPLNLSTAEAHVPLLTGIAESVYLTK